MAKRNEHSLEEIKALIIHAAEEIVIQDGFSAITARKVASAIGYTVGSLYMVFTSLSDLVMQLNVRTWDALAAHLSQPDVKDQPVFLESLARDYLQFAHQNFNRWSYALKYVVPTQSEETLQAEYQAKIEYLFLPVAAHLRTLRPDLSEEVVQRAARALWCSIQGTCLLLLNEQTQPADLNEIEQTLDLLVSHFLRGWLVSAQS